MERKNLVVDVAALAAYAAVANPALTGVGVHEWISLGLVVLFFAHCAMHVDWVVDTVTGAARRPSPARVGNLVLDVTTLVVFMVVIVSGLLVSGSVLLAFGLYADGYYFWDPLHAIAAKVLLALLLVHLVVHWKWLYRFFRKRGKDEGVRVARRMEDAHGD